MQGKKEKREMHGHLLEMSKQTHPNAHPKWHYALSAMAPQPRLRGRRVQRQSRLGFTHPRLSAVPVYYTVPVRVPETINFQTVFIM